mgnify:CR=1 FL=1
MSSMSAAKRIKIAVPSLLSEDVFGNFDLLSIIFSFFSTMTIVRILILIKLSFYRYIQNYEKSIKPIKKIIKYDFGYFVNKIENENSLALITNIYRHIIPKISVSLIPTLLLT